MSISPLNGFLYVDVEGNGIVKLNIEEVSFSKKEANKLKNINTKEDRELKELEKE